MRITRSLALSCVAVVALAACGGDDGVNSGDVVGPTTSAGVTTSAADTTVPDTSAVETTVAETTVAPTTEAPTTAAPATTATLPPITISTLPPVVDALADNTNLQPSNAISFTLPPGGEVCADFTPPGWVTDSCQSFVALENFYAVVQREAGDGHFRVVVLVPDGGADWISEYVAEEPGAGVWSAVTVVPGSFHFGSGPFNGDAMGLWVGYRYDGTGQYLDVDVVEWNEDGTATRGALKELDHGGVDLRAGGADVRSAVYGPSDPGCCPSQVRVQTIDYRPTVNRWHIDTGTLVPVDDPAAAITSDL